MIHLDLVVGARPNFMKAAPVLAELRSRRPDWRIRLIHTGQHYDERMSDLFFSQLGVAEPDVNLGVGSGTHAVQTAQVMVALEEQFRAAPPNLVVVFGDVNSTLAGALVASKMQIPVAHVEAGLRSFDRSMPEEINRIITDTVADWLFTSEPSGETNLRSEGVPAERIRFVGNTMIDTLLKHRPTAEGLDMPARFGVSAGRYAVVTLHRPSNVDEPEALRGILAGLMEVAEVAPVLFPMHPRTRRRLEDRRVVELEAAAGITLMEPLGYLEFVGLMAAAGVVITDSGGIQEETTILGVPCVTMRANTERPVTLTAGTNVLAGTDPRRMVAEAIAALGEQRRSAARIPDLWDGRAASRIVDVLDEVFSRQGEPGTGC